MIDRLHENTKRLIEEPKDGYFLTEEKYAREKNRAIF
jgi:hypothetical protein